MLNFLRKEGRLETVTYSTRSTGQEYISSGDIESLVDALIFPLNQGEKYRFMFVQPDGTKMKLFADNSYTEVFLASYRFFMPASELLTSLIEWYNVELDPATATPSQEQYFKHRKRQFRGRAAKVLLTWIKNHWHDFHADSQILDELSEFVGDLGGDISFGDGQRMTQAIREQRLSWYMTQYVPPFSAKRAPITEAVKPWGLLWEPEAFAAQLTLIDHHYFRQIRPDTYLSLLQRSVEKSKVAGDDAVKVLMDYVGFFRLVSSYTASLIYKEDTIKKRTKAIKKFIKIAKECRELNNFNTCFAVMHGLKRNMISKMTAAWDGLAAKHIDCFKEMETLMDPKGGYTNFWSELKNCVAPLIPFFAAYIHDLLEIHETEPVYTRDLVATNNRKEASSSVTTAAAAGYKIVTTDSIQEDTINFTKFYNLYSVVAEIEVWRSYSYNSVLPEAAAAANDPKVDMAGRSDSRIDAFQLRPLATSLSILSRADGSARFSFGKSSVLAAVYGPKEVKLRDELLDSAKIDVLFRPLVGISGTAERFYERTIREILEIAILKYLHPRTCIQVTVQVISDDGCILSSAINATILALLDAGVPLKNMVASVTCIVNSERILILDPSKSELDVKFYYQFQAFMFSLFILM
ncbi:Exosome component 5 [Physocladia obscura]|uniref:Exosome component 5 n=1 Tax=Physocladia obscura TaxID=109957 RepID=A0AAD5XDV9_9FUNG|nr:Exosome component 5 [Physocladia obscura]